MVHSLVFRPAAITLALMLSWLQLVAPSTTVDLLSWSFNLDTGIIQMTWNSGMDAASLDASKITIQQNSTVGAPYNLMKYTLTSNTTSYTTDLSPSVEVTIGALDWYGIQAAYDLATDRPTSWITMESGAIKDRGGTANEPIVDGNALRASTFVDDYTVPYLKYFSLDMNQGILTLVFNEVVDASILDSTGLAIRQYENFTASGEGISYNLSATSVHSLTGQLGNYSTVPIVLSFTDLNNIKLLKTLAVDSSSTWLTCTSSVTKDMRGYPLTARDKTNAVAVRNFIPDRTPPALQFFSLDVNVGIIRFLFQEAVDIATLDVTKITICSKQDCSGTKHTISAASYTPATATSSHSVIIVLSTADKAALNTGDLAVDRFSTYLAITDELITDLAPIGNAVSYANKNSAILQSNAYAVDKYIKVGISNYNLNINGTCMTSATASVYGCSTSTGQLTLYFNDIVNPATLDVTKIRLMEAKVLNVDSKEYYNGKQFYQLTPTYSSTSSPKGIEVVIMIKQGDLDQIKLRNVLATSQATTYLDLKSAAIKDLRDDEVTPYRDADVLNPAILVNTYAADLTEPSLLRFELNMNTGRMDLHFSEAVKVSTLDVSKLVLQAQRKRWMNIAHRFSAGTVNVRPDGTHVELVIANVDLNTLKVMRRLAHFRSSTYLVLEAGAIQDMVGNVVNPVPDGNAMLCSAFTADSTQPLLATPLALDHTTSLTHWTMDMNADLITMYFSEPVDSGMVNASGATGASGFVLHSSPSRNGSSYELGADSYVKAAAVMDSFMNKGINSVKMQLTMGFVDRNQVAVREGLCISKATCWLELKSNAVQDMAGNKVAAIPSTDPTEADPLKLQALGTETFTPDTTPPTLKNWTLDLSGAVPPVLSLHFSEAVKSSTLNVSRFTLQKEHHKYNAINGSGFFTIRWQDLYTLTPEKGTGGSTLSYSTSTIDADGTTLNVRLSNLDANAIKRRSSLARDVESSWLTVVADAVRDMAALPLVAIVDGAVAGGEPLQAASVVVDTTPPSVERFSLDVRKGLLFLKFSEAIDPASLDLTKFLLQPAAAADFPHVENQTHMNETMVVRLGNTTQAYQLASAALCNRHFMPELANQESARYVSLNSKFLCQVPLGSYATQSSYTLYQHGIDVMVRLNAQEIAKLRSLRPMGTDPVNTYLSFQGGVAKDYAGNVLVEVLNTSAMAMHQVDCSPCQQGSYMSKQCTLLEDRVCTTCSVCPYDHFANVECKPDEDTQCQRCTVCAYNYFVSTPCAGPQDTVCSRCTECGWNEFETRPCEMGLDRTCQTCDSCALSTMEKENNQEAKCRKSSLTWRKINCCYDTDGNQVKPCKDLGLQEFKISARDSRRDEVWCKRFDREKKQCMDQMGGNTNVPVPSYGVEDTNRRYSDINYN